MTQTRREFLTQVAASGGYRAAYLMMQGLGLLATEVAAEPLALAAGRHGTRVAILGAGIGGLSAAYELRKAGYECTVLEARERVGGRVWTVRQGSKVSMIDGSTQTCEFDPGLYLNAGAGRLPSRHTTIIGYCRELQVPLEVEVNSCRAAELANADANGGHAVEMRQAINDTRGAVAELLGKAINRRALDAELTARDKERLLVFLQQYGDLTPQMLYRGSARSGYKVPRGGVDETGSPRDPLPLRVLLDEDLWSGMLFEDLLDQQATMFQPVGGMDRIPCAFAKSLGERVRLRCEVTEIRRVTQGGREQVRITYRDGNNGSTQVLLADFCLITVPLSVLKSIPSDFSPQHRTAIADLGYFEAVKIAWQSRRFWETEYGIYGGLSFVKDATSVVWYPSDGLFSAQGVLIAGYAPSKNGERVAARPLAEQLAMSRATIERLHPGHSRELTRPLALAWSKIPHSLGATPEVRPEQIPQTRVLNQPDGPFYFAGEYLSQLGSWQEGSLLAARRMINLIEQQRKATAAN